MLSSMVNDYQRFEASTPCIINQEFMEQFQKRETGASISFLLVWEVLHSFRLLGPWSWACTLLGSVGKTVLFSATVQRTWILNVTRVETPVIEWFESPGKSLSL